jgi:3,4-dihydroxy 2-butanone 4-phosphate synthase/GTP cyclohydrolase II
MSYDSVQQLLDALRAGRMVVICDDEQDGEGSLMMAAERTDAPAINFMAMHARGLICLGLSQAHCQRLGLALMVPHSRAPHGMDFTCSIEARIGVSTGISAADRAHSIQVAMDPKSGAHDVVQPGHVFPVQAAPGGVMQRAGHAEAACDLTRLAGYEAAATLVSVLDEDGELARGEALLAFARKHQLPIGSISELIHYRILHEGAIGRGEEYPLQTRHGLFRVLTYRDEYLGRGELIQGEPTLVRVQALETLRDALGCEPQSGLQEWNLDRSLAHIAGKGNGVLVLLAQREHPDAVLGQLHQRRDGRLRPAHYPQRTLGIGAQILRDLGVRKMALMSSVVPYKAVSGFELEVSEFIPYRPEGA